MRIFIVEDEDIHIETATMAIEMAGYRLSGYCSNADKAVDEIKKASPDIVLVDIALPGKNNGIDIAKTLKNDLNIPHIFITSFKDESTIKEAVETNPVTYLTKPVEAPMLMAAVELSQKRSNKEAEAKIPEQSTPSKTFFVKVGDKQIKIESQEIKWIESAGQNYLDIVLTPSKKIAIRSTIKEILSKIDNKSFVQIHRAFAINIKHLEYINESTNSAVINGKEIPIGRTYRKEFEKCIRKI